MKSLYEGSEFTKLIAANAEILRLRDQLTRANTIIGWMMPFIGVMAPPDGGLMDLNDHCLENRVTNPKRQKCDRPIKQSVIHNGR